MGSDRSICASEPAVVPIGVRVLQLEFPVYDLPETAGNTLVLDITVNAIIAPGATVNVLTGTREYDSQMTLTDLQIPVSPT